MDSAHLDFTVLPHEIINDIIAIAGEKLDPDSKAQIDHQFLIQLDGPWGDFARNSTPAMLIFQKVVLRNFSCGRWTKTNETELSFEEAKKEPIRHSVISNCIDLEQLRQLAPNLYESVSFFKPKIPSDVLNLFGNRFSEISWWTTWKTGINNWEIEFLKRQLRSKYLRKLTVESVKLQDEELNKLLVDFVKKPYFELLGCYGCFMPAEVLIEAEKAWKARNSFEIGYQKVSGIISGEAVEQLKEHFQIRENEEENRSVDHPIQNGAKYNVSLYVMRFSLAFETLT